MDLKSTIRNLPDYPKKGVVFRDITTLIANEQAFAYSIDQLAERVSGYAPTTIAGIEARGFIVGAAVAYKLGLGFISIRKPGKLPFDTIGEDYELEYGSDRVEVHVDSFSAGDKVVLIDDLIATGGTALAACTLIKQAKAAIAGAGFIVDLPELGGSNKLEASGVQVISLVEYEGL